DQARGPLRHVEDQLGDRSILRVRRRLDRRLWGRIGQGGCHSGGSSSKSLRQSTAEALVASRPASAVVAVSIPLHISRFTMSLSIPVRDLTYRGSSPSQIVATTSSFA